MAAPCSGGLETTSGASFVDACAEAVLSPEVLPNFVRLQSTETCWLGGRIFFWNLQTQ